LQERRGPVERRRAVRRPFLAGAAEKEIGGEADGGEDEDAEDEPRTHRCAPSSSKLVVSQVVVQASRLRGAAETAAPPTQTLPAGTGCVSFFPSTARAASAASRDSSPSSAAARAFSRGRAAFAAGPICASTRSAAARWSGSKRSTGAR